MKYTFESIEFSDKHILNNIINNKNEYDETTTEKYRTLRLLKIDPIFEEEIDKNLLFEYKYSWDAITGEKKDIDEFGPLCFNAWTLYEYYYKNRYNGLWIPSEENYQGYYGNLVGSGKDLKINGKFYPEKYLYRLPIIDCYLKKNHNYSIITMGPVLTDDDINNIDKLILKIRKNKPSLKILKEYYDESLNNSPNINELKKKYSDLTDMDLKEKYNRIYVDKLLKL